MKTKCLLIALLFGLVFNCSKNDDDANNNPGVINICYGIVLAENCPGALPVDTGPSSVIFIISEVEYQRIINIIDSSDENCIYIETTSDYSEEIWVGYVRVIGTKCCDLFSYCEIKPTRGPFF